MYNDKVQLGNQVLKALKHNQTSRLSTKGWYYVLPKLTYTAKVRKRYRNSNSRKTFPIPALPRLVFATFSVFQNLYSVLQLSLPIYNEIRVHFSNIVPYRWKIYKIPNTHRQKYYLSHKGRILFSVWAEKKPFFYWCYDFFCRLYKSRAL